jgi:gas vesicle protein
MNKHGFVKGITVGVVAGAALGALAASKSRDAKRVVGKFIRAASDIVEDISSLWR